ncbi:MAG TPA: PAS domain S-box protein [Kiritimatiellia bacterium]|nr:PAS domain S-box protein [Kiritimatiellia bacterium]
MLPRFTRTIRFRLLATIVGTILSVSLLLWIFHARTHMRIVSDCITIMKDDVPHDAENTNGGEKLIAALEQASRDHLRAEAWWFAVVWAVMLAASTWLSVHITRPIREITATARQVVHDRREEFDKPDDDGDDVQQLHRAVRIMAKHLQIARASLTQKSNELNRTQQTLRRFFDQSKDILGIADYDTRIIDVNSGFIRLLDYDRDWLIGRKYTELIHPDDQDRVAIAVEDLRQGQELVEFESRFRDRTGVYHRIAWNVATHQEFGCIYAVGRDITEQRRLEEEIVRSSTAERERMARDIHDGLGQTMTGLAYKAKLIEAILTEGARPEPAQAAELVSLANQATREARAIARGLDPVELQQGLLPALEYLALSSQELFGIGVRIESEPGATEGLDRVTASHLYRIAQEAITNAIRHSQPDSVAIYLTRTEKLLELVVIDSGGEAKKNPEPGSGQGLRIMQYRARIMGGNLAIKPVPSGGLMVKCSVNIHYYEQAEDQKVLS